MPSEHDPIAAAANRLRGLLVDTPLIGGPLLAGRPAMPELRIKPECLQPGGSIWFRGAMHALARQMGAAAGIVAQGGSRQVLATVVAAQAQRVPVVACVADELVGEALLVAAGASAVERCADPAAAAAAAERLRARTGYRLAAQSGDPDFDDGIATAGLELAQQLPHDVELVAVSPGELAPALRRGLQSAGAGPVTVVGVGGDTDAAVGAGELAKLAQALADGPRLCSDPQGLLALHSALSGRFGVAPCVVLSC